MPPLGATLAATVAVGVGVALAKIGRERLTARRAAVKDLALAPGEPLPDGLKRMALEQVDLAIGQLDTRDGAPGEKAVHESRKALKRLRTMFRLLETPVGKDAFARETDALRDVAGHLAGARDSKVVLATLDALLERRPRKLARNPGVRTLHEHLAREHERICRETLGEEAVLTHVLGQLRLTRGRVETWHLPPGNDIELAEPGLGRLYGQGRQRYHRAAAGKGEQMLAMHEWRKRVKDLRYVAEMLQRSAPSHVAALPAAVSPPARKRRARERKSSKPLRRIARRADELGELLGEDHDLAVLAEVIRARPRPRGDAPRLGRRTRKRLLKAISRRRHELRRRALRKGERLYGSKPKKFLRGLRS